MRTMPGGGNRRRKSSRKGDVLQAGRAIRWCRTNTDIWRSIGNWTAAALAPGVVARRRFGDGKDLSFLLAHLLRRLGVPARLVLVNDMLRKSVANYCPPRACLIICWWNTAPAGNRWVDATLKRQAAFLDRWAAIMARACHAGLSQLADPPRPRPRPTS